MVSKSVYMASQAMILQTSYTMLCGFPMYRAPGDSSTAGAQVMGPAHVTPYLLLTLGNVGARVALLAVPLVRLV